MKFEPENLSGRCLFEIFISLEVALCFGTRVDFCFLMVLFMGTFIFVHLITSCSRSRFPPRPLWNTALPGDQCPGYMCVSLYNNNHLLSDLVFAEEPQFHNLMWTMLNIAWSAGFKL